MTRGIDVGALPTAGMLECEACEIHSRVTQHNILMLASIRPCYLWHHMFTQEPQSLDFLQAQFVHSSMEEHIQCHISRGIALSGFYKLSIYEERGTSQNLFCCYFSNTWAYMEIMTQNVKFPIWSQGSKLTLDHRPEASDFSIGPVNLQPDKPSTD